MSDNRENAPVEFWTDVCMSRADPGLQERRRRRRGFQDAFQQALADQRRKILAVLRERTEELRKDAVDAKVFSPNCVEDCRSRRKEANHIMRLIARLK